MDSWWLRQGVSRKCGQGYGDEERRDCGGSLGGCSENVSESLVGFLLGVLCVGVTSLLC